MHVNGSICTFPPRGNLMPAALAWRARRQGAPQPVVERLREATANPLHEFWANEVSLLDAAVEDAARIHGPRQSTDGYLLALAA